MEIMKKFWENGNISEEYYVNKAGEKHGKSKSKEENER